MVVTNSEKLLTHLVAVVDTILALIVISVVSFQFAKGTSLLTGPQNDIEKIARLSLYACIIYVFLMIHLTMAFKLYGGAGMMKLNPDESIKIFGWWREWSIVYLMLMLFHAIVVLILMEEGQRRTISLFCSLGHATIRPVFIVTIGWIKHNMEHDLPVKF